MKETICIRITEELKATLQALADADKRKLGDYLRIQLEMIATQPKPTK